MKQVEFDETLRQMRVERDAKIAPLKRMIAELEVEINKKGEQLHRMNQEYAALRLQKSLLNKDKTRIEIEHNERYMNFIKNNEGHVSRNLEDVSDFAIINELSARGFTLVGGVLSNSERTEETLNTMNGMMQPKDEAV